MKMSLFAPALVAAAFLTGCAHVGTGGSGLSESGTGAAHGAANIAGAVAPLNDSGYPDETIAENRAEDSRSGTPWALEDFAQPGVEANAAAQSPLLASPQPENANLAADRIVLQRIQLALSTAQPKEAAILEPFSMETLHDVRITVNQGWVTLRGQVKSFEQKKNIEARVRAVPGVEFVRNELQVEAPAPILGAPVGAPAS